MFPEMRRKDRQLSAAEAWDILSRAEYGTLSTAGENGYPYSVPFNFACEGGRIYLHCSTAAGCTLRNLALSDKVCFTAVGRTKPLPERFATLYESAVVFGRARLLDDPEEKRRGLVLLLKKYSPDFMAAGEEYIKKLFDETGVIEICAEHISGKARRPSGPSNLEYLHKE